MLLKLPVACIGLVVGHVQHSSWSSSELSMLNLCLALTCEIPYIAASVSPNAVLQQYKARQQNNSDLWWPSNILWVHWDLLFTNWSKACTSVHSEFLLFITSSNPWALPKYNSTHWWAVLLLQRCSVWPNFGCRYDQELTRCHCNVATAQCAADQGCSINYHSWGIACSICLMVSCWCQVFIIICWCSFGQKSTVSKCPTAT